MSTFDISDLRALVVGVGGVGAAIAHGLADHRARVAVADLDAARAGELAVTLRHSGIEAVGIGADVTDEHSVDALLAAVVEHFGGLDLLVNAAGISVRKRAEEVTAEEWRHVIDVNATGTFLCCQAAGRTMAKQGGGTIVNLSSVRGRFGSTLGQTEYSASKGAVDALTRSLAAQWAEFGIRVNAVAPTFVAAERTRSVPTNEDSTAALRANTLMGRPAEEQDVVGPVLFLASPAARFINGQVLYVDRGLTACI
ncbi:MAG: SDR family NAD(P)-dependent oxidoreductase [Thermoleophilia bacterium]